jgi:hypothetical protein
MASTLAATRKIRVARLIEIRAYHAENEGGKTLARAFSSSSAAAPLSSVEWCNSLLFGPNVLPEIPALEKSD